MKRVEFHTLLQGGTQKGHRVFIATAPGQSQLLGDAPSRFVARVNLNGHVFDAEGWPANDGHHVIEVPPELVDAAGLRAGDAAQVAIHRMGE